MKKKKSGRAPIARVLVIFSIMVMVLNIAIVVNRGMQAYDNSIEAGKSESKRLLSILNDHAELTFLAADITLRRASDRQYFNALFGDNLQQDMQNHLRVWVNQTPQIAAMVMTDEFGFIQAIYRAQGYKTWLEGKETLITQDYFTHHQLGDDPEALYIAPKQSWIRDDKGIIVMSRRITKLDGSFGGIVLVAINNAYLLDFFASLEADSDTKVILMRGSGEELISEISIEDEKEKVTNLLPQLSEEREQVVDVVGVETNKFLNERDVRMYALSRIETLDLAIGMVLHGEDIFKGWNADRLHDAAFIGMFGLFALVISFFAVTMAGQMRRVQTSERSAVLASQAKTEFLANMSHELRTPLNAVIGFSEMMSAGYFGHLNAKQTERIKDIHMCGTHLLELINDILEFSKGEAGKLELREERVDIKKLMQSTVRIVSERAKSGKLELNIHYAETLPSVYVDERKIKQMLLNILTNGIKFTPEGGKVDVSVRIGDDLSMEISVKDSGIGMNPQDIPKALSVFGQVHTDASYGGTGLGLPLCKMLIELHGGRLEIESSKGEGTEVSVSIPASRVMWETKQDAEQPELNYEEEEEEEQDRLE